MKAAADPWATPARRVGRLAARLVVRGFPRRFGLFEMAALGSVEWMRRHLAFINELEALRGRRPGPLRVLDFGGGEGALGRALALYGLADAYAVTVVDIEEAAIRATPIRPPIRAAIVIEPDGELPFASGTFDVVVSSDVFEHIPRSHRAHWAGEISRVSAGAQIHSVPCDSADGRWNSTAADRLFLAWYEDRNGGPERWTAEHLDVGAPMVEELAALFAATRVVPIVNSAVWFAAMKAQYGPRDPLARLRFVLGYEARMRRRADEPPYKNCLFVVDGGAADHA